MLTDLVKEIRDFLHDPDGDRWKTSRILYYIDKAQKDMCNKSHALSGSTRIGLREDMDTIKLPNELINITEVRLNGCILPIVTRDQLGTEYGKCLNNERGTPEYALLDQTNRHQLELYPRPNETTSVLYQSSKWGLFSDLGTDTFGVITDCTTVSTEIIGNGTTASISYDKAVLEVFYNKKPKLINNVNASLEIDDIYEQAIKYYVCGQLLRSDKDSSSRSLGNEELSLYAQELRQLKKDKSYEFATGNIIVIPYRKI